MTCVLDEYEYLHCGLTETSRLEPLDDVCGPLDGFRDFSGGRWDKLNTRIVPKVCQARFGVGDSG